MDLKKFFTVYKSNLTRWSNEMTDKVLSKTRLQALKLSVAEKIELLTKREQAALDDTSIDVAEVLQLSDLLDEYRTLFAVIGSHLDVPLAPAQKLSHVNLHKINIDPFYGSIFEFQQFWSLFLNCIDQNESLDDATKLSYLLTLVKGEAAEVLQGLVVSPDNYLLAKDLLVETFSQSNKIIHSLFNDFLNIPKTSDNLSSIKALYKSMFIISRSLANNDIDIDIYSKMFVPQIFSKVPSWLKNKYVSSERDDWTVSGFMRTLKSHISLEDASDFSSTSKSISLSQNFPGDSTYSSLVAYESSASSARHKLQFCIFCDKKCHYSSDCQKVISLTDRYAVLKAKRLCFKCFKTGHLATKCISTRKCQKCQASHHIALCDNDLEQVKHEETVANTVTSNVSSPKVCANVLLQHAQITVSGVDLCNTRKVNVLFDTGSHVSFISESVVAMLALSSSSHRKMSITSFMQPTSIPTTYPVVKVNLHAKNESYPIRAVVVPRISPLKSDCTVLPREFEHLEIARSAIAEGNSEVDILIGMDYYWTFMNDHIVRSSAGATAISTVFGYIVSGSVTSDKKPSDNLVSNFLISSKTLEESFEQNIDHIFNHDFSFLGGVSDDIELNYFLKNISFDESLKRYSACLPWKDKTKVHNHFELSKKRLAILFKRLCSTPDILAKYNELIYEQLEAGVIEKCDPPDSSFEGYHYMPHHCVVREKAASTKVRIVYDGSAKRCKLDLSINECLNVGPKLIPLLLPILLGFRTHKFGFIADLEKAFLMVAIDKKDQDFLRFLWYSDITDSSKPLLHLRFLRLPFGLVCSPAVLNAVLKHHLTVSNSDSSDKFYVDDLVHGFETAEQGTNLIQEVGKTLGSASFRLQKLATNCSEISQSMALEYSEVINVLGVPWVIDHDALGVKPFHLQSIIIKCTKRDLLRTLSSVFDPLGILSPVTVGLRILMQETWRLNLGWDQALAPELNQRVSSYLDILHDCERVSVGRRMCNINEKLIVYGFCDASAQAVSCVFYCVSLDSDGARMSEFCVGKSRVAPLNPKHSIPRLELLSALLLVNVYASFSSKLPSHNYLFFSDSLCTLFWIKNIGKLWKQYVQSRVDKIRQFSSPAQWFHVPGYLNPADYATRGICTSETIRAWLRGPDFIRTSSMPDQPQALHEEGLGEEVIVSLVNDETYPSDPLPSLDISRFSSYTRLLSCVARIICLFHLDNTTYFEHFSKAELMLVKSIQFRHLSSLQLDIAVGRERKLIWQLQLILQDGVIFVKTRLPTDSFATGKQLFLLPDDSAFVTLVVRYFHEKTFHGGLSLTLAALRQQFWIIRARGIVKRILNSCVFCRKIRGKPFPVPAEPILPPFRVAGCAFRHIGVDYAGPFHITTGKCYILLITCAVSRAIHLELCQDLTAQECLWAIQRFVSRRGYPRIIISDNAKTFESAAGKLGAVRCSTSVAMYLAENRINWLFNCSRAPWWGGFFERMVGIMKNVLVKAVPKTGVLTGVEFSTILCKIEEIVNSRPLTYISSNDHTEVLTPGHLLGNLKSLDDPLRLPFLEAFDQEQNHREELWQQFVRLYVSSLREKSSPKRMTGSLAKVGDICFMNVASTKQWTWPLVRIVQLCESKDGVVRKALVKNSKGIILERVLQHLVPLEGTS